MHGSRQARHATMSTLVPSSYRNQKQLILIIALPLLHQKGHRNQQRCSVLILLSGMPVKHRPFNMHFTFYVSPLREPKQSPVRSSSTITKHAEWNLTRKRCSKSQI